MPTVAQVVSTYFIHSLRHVNSPPLLFRHIICILSVSSRFSFLASHHLSYRLQCESFNVLGATFTYVLTARTWQGAGENQHKPLSKRCF